MSQVQNSYFTKQTLAPPVAFFALAALAGRFIQYFPGASQKGLLLTAGAGSAASLIYDWKFQDPEYHAWTTTAFRKVLVIAVATLGAALAAKKALAGRVELSPLSAARFGAVECLAAAIISYATQEPALQREHRYYSANLKEWRALETEERTRLVQEFYQAGLPAISLFHAETDIPFNRDSFKDDLPSYTPAQLSWYRELFDGIFYMLSPDNRSQFIKRCHQNGIKPTPSMIRNLFLQPPEWLYQEFVDTPIYQLAFARNIDTLFPGQPPFPDFEQYLSNLTVADVEAMDPWVLNQFISSIENYENINQATLIALLKRSYELSIQIHYSHNIPSEALVWINDLDPESFSEENKGCLRLLLRWNQHLIGFRIIQALNHNEQRQIPYYLSSEVVRAAQSDDSVLTTLKEQFSGYQDYNWGFSELSLADQKALKDLFAEDRGKLPSYKFQANSVSTLQANPSLVDELKEELRNANAIERCGFQELSPEDQEVVRGLLAPDVPLPYYMTPELVTRAKAEPVFAQTLVTQFENGGGRDYGFFQLSPAQQDDFRAHVFVDKDNALYLPYQITPALIADPNMHAKVKAQYQAFQYNIHPNAFGVDALTYKEIVRLLFIVHDPSSFHGEPISFVITQDIITEAENDPEFVALLVEGFQREVLSAKHCTQLSEDQLAALHTLFVDQAHLLPLWYSANLVAKVLLDAKLQAQLKRQFKASRLQTYRSSFGFEKCPKKEKLQLLLCLGKESVDDISFSITEELVTLEFKKLFIEGFQNEILSAKHCTQLSQDELAKLDALFGDQAHLLPVLITDAVVAQATSDPVLVERLVQQLNKKSFFDRTFFGLETISVKSSLTLLSLLGKRAYLMNFEITTQVIEAAEQDVEIQEQLIGKFKNKTLDRSNFQYGFKDQERLTKLFGAENAHLIPE